MLLRHFIVHHTHLVTCVYNFAKLKTFLACDVAEVMFIVVEQHFNKVSGHLPEK